MINFDFPTIVDISVIIKIKVRILLIDGQLLHYIYTIETFMFLPKYLQSYTENYKFLLRRYELYKKHNSLSKKIGLKFENMEQMDKKDLEQVNHYIFFSNVINSYRTYNNISIGEFRDSSRYYYVVLPGFTIEECFDYFKLLQKCNEPHPFSELSKCLEIPYILFHDFSKKEISEAVQLLKKYSIIKPIADICPGEMRYDICNDSVKKILNDYWFLHILDFYISFQRLVYDKKPFDADKEYMKLYLGEKKLDHKLALIYNLRKKNKEIFEKEIPEKYSNIEELKITRNKIVENIEKYTGLLKENDIYLLSLVRDLFNL
jgi:hypothetical protein